MNNYWEKEETLIDYTEHVAGCYGVGDSIIAQGKGRNFLAISRLDNPLKRFDGKKAQYQVTHRSLTKDCESNTDEAFCCVACDDFTYWTTKELKNLLANIKNGTDVNLFDFFSLCS